MPAFWRAVEKNLALTLAESLASQPVKTDILPFGNNTMVLIPKSGRAMAATLHGLFKIVRKFQSTDTNRGYFKGFKD